MRRFPRSARWCRPRIGWRTSRRLGWPIPTKWGRRMSEPLPLPGVLLARIRREEMADESCAELARMDQADQAAMARRMAELSSHYHEHVTGHDLHTWERARMAIAQARGDLGLDPSAPVGSAKNPEL